MTGHATAPAGRRAGRGPIATGNGGTGPVHSASGAGPAAISRVVKRLAAYPALDGHADAGWMILGAHRRRKEAR
jgi:hypothetical protein